MEMLMDWAVAIAAIGLMAAWLLLGEADDEEDDR